MVLIHLIPGKAPVAIPIPKAAISITPISTIGIPIPITTISTIRIPIPVPSPAPCRSFLVPLDGCIMCCFISSDQLLMPLLLSSDELLVPLLLCLVPLFPLLLRSEGLLLRLARLLQHSRARAIWVPVSIAAAIWITIAVTIAVAVWGVGEGHRYVASPC